MRAPVRWFGGKGNMLARLLPLIPAGGRPYCEPFAGGASVLFARQPAPVEVLNDLDRRLVTLFRVLQDPVQYREFEHRVRWTLYAREEIARALEILRRGEDDPVTLAWAMFVAQNQGMSGMIHGPGSWSRTFVSVSGMADTTNKWLMRQRLITAWHERLMRVQIDCRDALEGLAYWDHDEAVFYVDPPYVPDTRADKRVYRHEMSNADHARLIDVLLGLRGAVVLSGYPHAIYTRLDDAGWRRHVFETACYAAVRHRQSGLQGVGTALEKASRLEVVWQNPRAVALCRAQGKQAAEQLGFSDMLERAEDEQETCCGE